MRVKVRESDIRPPEADSNKWEFGSVSVYGDDEKELHTGPFVISDPDFQECFRQGTGRYPDGSVGAKTEKEDLLKNWNAVSPKLSTFF